MVITEKTIDPVFSPGIPVLHGFNWRPVYADNFCVGTEIDDPIALQMEMPADYFYAGDEYYLNCNLYPIGDSVISAQLFIMLSFNGAMYFYPTWEMFTFQDLTERSPDNWSSRIDITGKTTLPIIRPFTMKFIAFQFTGLSYMSVCSSPDFSTLISNIDIVEWGFGGERPH